MKILIIEDDISIRNVLRIGLEELSYTVDEAEDGERGSYFARVNKYDLIILDNVLPHKLGKQVCEEVRGEGIKSPILLLSGKGDIDSKVSLLDVGADDYMTKPFSFLELQSRIKALTRRPHIIEDVILSGADIKLNMNTKEVHKEDELIPLTKKEFSLLELFMRNMNKVLTRSIIMEGVWSSEIDPFSNTVESHMRNLRLKLGDTHKRIIRNVPGQGYVFKNNYD